MKGIILSGGKGTRLDPLTRVTSKQLLHVYNRPMIYYPLNTLIRAGIKDILVIVAPENAGEYLNLLKNGKQFGVRIKIEIQSEPRGLPEALIIGEEHINDDNVTLILGDNIFEDDLAEDIKNFTAGAKIFAKKVPDPQRFGIVVLNEAGQPIQLIEKPQEWISDYAVTGLYVFDAACASISKRLKPSQRNELEIIDVLQAYLDKNQLQTVIITGDWIDAGTFESLYRAQVLSREKLQPFWVI